MPIIPGGSGGFVDPSALNLTSFVSGIIEGCQLAVNSPADNFIEIGTGKLVIADTFTDPLAPDIQVIEITTPRQENPNQDRRTKWNWLEWNGSSLDFRAEAGFEVSDTRLGVILGKSRDNNNGPLVTAAIDVPLPAFGTSYTSRDDVISTDSYGISGLEMTPNAINALQIDVAAGKGFRPFSEVRGGSTSPHVRLDAAQTPRGSYTYHAAPTGVTVSETQVQTDVWNDAGTVVTIPNNSNWIVQWVFYFPKSGSIHVIHSQNLYSNFNDAKAGINDVPDIDVETLFNSFVRGWLLIKDGATDLGNPTEAEIVNKAIGSART
jgi:hypothetical protein